MDPFSRRSPPPLCTSHPPSFWLAQRGCWKERLLAVSALFCCFRSAPCHTGRWCSSFACQTAVTGQLTAREPEREESQRVDHSIFDLCIFLPQAPHFLQTSNTQRGEQAARALLSSRQGRKERLCFLAFGLSVFSCLSNFRIKTKCCAAEFSNL